MHLQMLLLILICFGMCILASLTLAGYVTGIVFMSIAIHNWEPVYKHGACQPIWISGIRNQSCENCANINSGEKCGTQYECYAFDWIGYAIPDSHTRYHNSTFIISKFSQLNATYYNLTTSINQTTPISCYYHRDYDAVALYRDKEEPDSLALGLTCLILVGGGIVICCLYFCVFLMFNASSLIFGKKTTSDTIPTSATPLPDHNPSRMESQHIGVDFENIQL